MNRHLPWKIVGCTLVLFLISPLVLHAEVTGSISGVVSDPSGAIVPNAVVILRSGDTGLERKIQANAQGAFEFLAVPVGEKYSGKPSLIHIGQRDNRCCTPIFCKI